ncbi:MAG: ABC transporter permease [Ruminococcaceae bacterium]|nr:ABC transporter permease [Oscillospiraceae bacterium]
MRSFGYLLKEGIKSLWKNRTMSIASIAVLLSCLLLTGIAILVSVNMDSAMKSIEGSNSITVYLDDDLPQITAIQIGEEIRAMENIASCDFISKDDALFDIMQSLGDDGELFEGYTGGNNFLPDAYNISIKDLSKYNETMEAIEAIEGVSEYTDYSNIATKLSSLDRLIKIACIAIIAILGVVSLFIIANTIKVTMFSRRTEIQIMKSVGATNWFIRVPFVVEGLLIGVISGSLSAGVIHLAYDKAVQVIYNVVPFLNMVDIDPYIINIYIIYCIAGSIFGILGSLISMGRYLHREGENAVA